MNEEFVAGFGIGMFLAMFLLLASYGCHRKDFRNDSVMAGHAEYYINPTNYSKEWRWKEVK